MIFGPEKREPTVMDLALIAIEEQDYDSYIIDPNKDPFVKYGETVLRGGNVEKDAQSVLLELAWRVRLDDVYGIGGSTERVNKMIKEKGRRFGFIFAYTLLNSCYAVEEDSGEDTFPEEMAEKKYKMSTHLQDFAVHQIEEYLQFVETINDGNQGQVLSDVKALVRTINRSFVSCEFWKDRVEEMKEKGERAGDSYLDVDHAIELLKVLGDFGQKEIVKANTEIEAEIDLTVGGYKERLKKVGIDIDEKQA